MRLTDPERDEIAGTARRLLTERSSSAQVRSLLEDPMGFDPRLLAEMVDLGWGASHLPESMGGYGVSLGDTYPVFVEMGRALVGGPLSTSALVAGGVLAAAPNRSLAEAIGSELVAGTSSVTVAIAGTHGHYTPAGLGVEAMIVGTTVRLSGTAHFVPDASAAQRAIVFARTGDGVVAVAVDLSGPGVTVADTEFVDRTRRAGTLSFAGYETGLDDLLAAPGEGATLLDAGVDLGATAMAMDSFGVGEVVLERTTEYVKQRFQFGRPIGSFQVMKHRLADAVLLVETSRVAVIDAAEAVSPLDPAPAMSRSLAASTAKSYVGDAMARLCQDALQSHGGIGFTWEHDMHLYLKRVLANQAFYGTSRWHRRRVADLVLDTATAADVSPSGRPRLPADGR
jgi:alkylation response protein AidB-like acyl-CoA dehydrogenase